MSTKAKISKDKMSGDEMSGDKMSGDKMLRDEKNVLLEVYKLHSANVQNLMSVRNVLNAFYLTFNIFLLTFFKENGGCCLWGC